MFINMNKNTKFSTYGVWERTEAPHLCERMLAHPWKSSLQHSTLLKKMETRGIGFCEVIFKPDPGKVDGKVS